MDRAAEFLNPHPTCQLAADAVVHWYCNLSQFEFHIAADIERLVPGVSASRLTWNEFLRCFDDGQIASIAEQPVRQPNRQFRFSIHMGSPPDRKLIQVFGEAFAGSHGWVFSGVISGNPQPMTQADTGLVQGWMYDYWFEHSQVASWIADSAGTLRRVNMACVDMFNVDRDSIDRIIGHYNLFEDKEFLKISQVDEVRKAFTEAQQISLEITYNLSYLAATYDVNKEGLQHLDMTIIVDLIPVKAADGQVAFVLVQHRDLSHEKEISNSLRQQDQLLHSIINNTSSIVSVTDLQGRFILVNQEFMRFTQVPIEKVCGLTSSAIFPKHVARFAEWQDQQVIQSQELVQVEEHIPTRDNPSATFLTVRFPIRDSDDNVYAVGAVMTDISSRKQNEDIIVEQRTELQLLLDSVGVYIWYLDRWGRVKTANRDAAELVPLEESYGKNFLEFMVNWDSSEERQREIMQVIRTGIPLRNSVERYTAKHGEERWFRVDKIPTKDMEQKVSGVLLVAADITDTVYKEQELKESDTRYKAFIANSADAIWRYDLVPPVPITLPLEEQKKLITERAVMAECNHVFARLCQARDPQDLEGTGLHSTGSVALLNDIEVFLAGGYCLAEKEVTVSIADDEVAYLSVSAQGTVADGFLQRIWGTSRNITETKHYMDVLEYQATHDSLTLLPNRNKLYTCVEEMLNELEPNRKAALLLIDLDRFKEINDTLGHYAGDHVLKQIGPRLESELQDYDGIVARLGGDEFAIFITNMLHAQKAVIFAHRVLDAISQPFELEGIYTEISASIGISIAPDQAHDVSTLLRYADIAMYRVKNDLSRVGVYKAEEDSHSAKRLTLLNELRKAIREDELVLYFQPKIGLEFGNVFGVEALLRWNHPRLGFVSPGEFIPLAEKTDVIEPMTLWVLRSALSNCREWLHKGFTLSVAVNLSSRNLMGEDIAERIAALLHEFQVPPQLLELEITESAIMLDPQRALAVLKDINRLGVSLAIDDFGTGYSSLAYIKKLPVSSLKIDYSFVINMLEDDQDEIIVNSTINLAHNLALKVVAEGVESQQVLERLAQLGCDHAQGYHVARPMPMAALLTWLDQTHWQSK